MKIRSVEISDALAISEIYNHYVLNTIVTFDEVKVSEDEMRTRITEVTKKYPWIVIEEDSQVVGYAYATTWKPRVSYRYSVECAIYLDKNQCGKGYGKALYRELFERLKPLAIHSLIGGITIPNPESIALHETLGFEKIAHFKEVGFKFGQWCDVGYWQKNV